jgi:IPT/TIG domain
VPNNSVLAFRRGGCYRIEGTLELRARRGLDFEGNGSSFRSSSPPSDHRALWRIIDSRAVSLHAMTIVGSYRKGGTFTASLQHAHAVDVDGSDVDIDSVRMSDVAGDCVYFGRGSTTALALSSGTVRNSTCMRTSRNAIAVVAGVDILVQHVTTGSIGYNVFDVEPNLDSGWGATGVTFDDNTIGSYAKNAYSIVENAPVSNQFFTNNRVVGQGLKIGITDTANAGYRAANVTISGNNSDTLTKPAAINVDNVDRLTVTGNRIPMAGGPMAAAVGVCQLDISGNQYPGGSAEALVYPTVCSFTPPRGSAGTTFRINGSGFNDASAVAVNGIAASFRVESSVQITAVVPRRAVSGPIRVTTPNGTASSEARFVVVGVRATSSR